MHNVIRFHGKHQASREGFRIPEIQGCRIPILRSSRVTGPQESTVAVFHGSKAPRFDGLGVSPRGSRVPGPPLKKW